MKKFVLGSISQKKANEIPSLISILTEIAQNPNLGLVTENVTTSYLKDIKFPDGESEFGIKVSMSSVESRRLMSSTGVTLGTLVQDSIMILYITVVVVKPEGVELTDADCKALLSKFPDSLNINEKNKVFFSTAYNSDHFTTRDIIKDRTIG